MEVLIQDLTDAQANELCAKAQEWERSSSDPNFSVWRDKSGNRTYAVAYYTPTTNPAQAFGLIGSLGEFGIDVWNHHGNKGARVTSDDGINMFSFTCGTPDGLARAIVNAFIASVYGDSIEIEGEG